MLSFPLDTYRSGTVGSYGSYIFKDTSIIFSIVAVLIYHQQCKRVPISPLLDQHLLVFVFLLTAIVTSVRWLWGDISLWVWFAFCWRLMMLSTFSSTYWSFYVFFGKMSIQILCPFFNWIVISVMKLYEYTYIHIQDINS